MFPLVFSPGPANIVFAASGAQVGVKRSLPLLAGIDSVFILKSLLVGFGFGKIIQHHPAILQSLQFLGAVYLIYLAIGFLRYDPKGNSQRSQLMGFKEGVIVQLLNAKGWVMVLLMFSLFSEHAHELFGGGAIVALVAMLAALNVSLHLVWIKVGDLITRFSSSARNRKLQAYFYCSSLVSVAIWLVVDNSFWKQ